MRRNKDSALCFPSKILQESRGNLAETFTEPCSAHLSAKKEQVRLSVLKCLPASICTSALLSQSGARFSKCLEKISSACKSQELWQSALFPRATKRLVDCSLTHIYRINGICNQFVGQM